MSAKPDSVQVVVLGAHLKGLPLHSQLQERQAKLVKSCRTAPKYRFFAFDGETPKKPGLIEVGSEQQPASIEVEVYEMDTASFGSFVALIPPPLTMGHVELDDGSVQKCFRTDEFAIASRKAKDITEFGGWRKYLESLQGDAPPQGKL